MNHKTIFISQAVFLLIVLASIWIVYPSADVKVNGNIVNIDSGKASLIILSKNPDFTNPRYLDIQKDKDKNITLSLKPGKYYWKASNGIIEGLSHEFEISSKVGLEIQDKENATSIVNVGDVKVNVSRNKEGVLVGHIILEPNQADQIENSGVYSGVQDE
jgi:hypothetical protein